jgi:hypothetical protein
MQLRGMSTHYYRLPEYHCPPIHPALVPKIRGRCFQRPSVCAGLGALLTIMTYIDRQAALLELDHSTPVEVNARSKP